MGSNIRGKGLEGMTNKGSKSMHSPCIQRSRNERGLWTLEASYMSYSLNPYYPP